MKINCPHCQQSISVDDQWAGMTANCPTCRGGFEIFQHHVRRLAQGTRVRHRRKTP